MDLRVSSLVVAPAPLLRARSSDISSFDAQLTRFVAAMTASMHRLGGVGLAAVQIGVPVRVFTVTVNARDHVYVNPVVELAEHWVPMAEGCLSLPGQTFTPLRPSVVELRWQDLSGSPRSGRFTGLHAEIVAHEMDHLEGVLLDDPTTQLASVRPTTRPGSPPPVSGNVPT